MSYNGKYCIISQTLDFPSVISKSIIAITVRIPVFSKFLGAQTCTYNDGWKQGK